jgi:hypothetical protein
MNRRPFSAVLAPVPLAFAGRALASPQSRAAVAQEAAAISASRKAIAELRKVLADQARREGPW